jgi:hypothetical protein
MEDAVLPVKILTAKFISDFNGIEVTQRDIESKNERYRDDLRTGCSEGIQQSQGISSWLCFFVTILRATTI